MVARRDIFFFYLVFLLPSTTSYTRNKQKLTTVRAECIKYVSARLRFVRLLFYIFFFLVAFDAASWTLKQRCKNVFLFLSLLFFCSLLELCIHFVIVDLCFRARLMRFVVWHAAVTKTVVQFVCCRYFSLLYTVSDMKYFLYSKFFVWRWWDCSLSILFIFMVFSLSFIGWKNIFFNFFSKNLRFYI